MIPVVLQAVGGFGALSMDTSRFLQAVVEGISLAGIYALIAIGFVIIYKSTQVLSFAQPALLIVGAYLASYISITLGYGFWVGVGLAILLSGAVGYVAERAVLRPMLGKPVFATAILTIGLDIAMRVVLGDLIGVNIRAIGTPVTEGFGAPSVPWGNTPVRWGDADGFGGVVIQPRVFAIVATVAVVVGVLTVFFSRSRWGLAMRGSSFDQEVALAQGVKVGKVFSLAWIIGGALAGLAGVLAATSFTGLSQSSYLLALKALPVVVVGGLDSIGGAIGGALIIGLAESFTATYQAQYLPFLGDNFSQVVPYVVMVIVLMVRPYGIWGTQEVERI
ncbi:MAG: branched-chain amino acid ABC transporter permease [Acidimicrobiia bacterium]